MEWVFSHMGDADFNDPLPEPAAAAAAPPAGGQQQQQQQQDPEKVSMLTAMGFEGEAAEAALMATGVPVAACARVRVCMPAMPSVLPARMSAPETPHVRLTARGPPHHCWHPAVLRVQAATWSAQATGCSPTWTTCQPPSQPSREAAAAAARRQQRAAAAAATGPRCWMGPAATSSWRVGGFEGGGGAAWQQVQLPLATTRESPVHAAHVVRACLPR
jgi:hypothetical protein